MAGISESIDLNITAALAKVKELDAAITKAGNVHVKVDSAGIGSATTGLKAVSSEANLAATATGGLGSVLGKARGELGSLASTAAGTVSPALGQMGGLLSGVGTSLIGPQGLVVGAIAVTAALGEMALHGVKDLVALASQVRLVQRATGATAEDASKLVAVGRALGVSAETEAAAFFKLSRNIQGHSDVLAADGIVVARTKTGQVDLSATLLSVSDAYNKAGKGAEGNKVLFDAFGRSGLALAPILAQSREQLQKFFEEADKHHEILSQDTLDKAREFKLATHDLSEAFGGLERELGLAILPLLISFAKIVTDVVERVDSVGHAVGAVTKPFGGLGSVMSDITNDAVPGLLSGIDLLRGHYRQAVVDIVPFGNSLDHLIFGHSKAKAAAEEHAAAEAKAAAAIQLTAQATGVSLPRLQQLAQELGIDLSTATDKENKKLAETAAKLNEAVTPTQRLATVTGTLSNQFATTSETMKAYKIALDATLNSQIGVQESAISTRDAFSKLAEAQGKGRDKTETLQQYQDRLSTSTIAVVKAVEAQALALANNGTIPAAGQAAFLRETLLAMASTTSGPVRQSLLDYAAQLGAIPTVVNTTVTAEVSQALAALHQVRDAFGNLVGGSAGSDALDRAQQHQSQFANQAAKQAESAAKAAADAYSTRFKAIFDQGSKIGADAGAKAAKAAAKAVETTLRESAKPGQGLDLGGFIVKGLELGAAGNKVLANNAVLSLTKGMADVVKKAQIIDPTEALGILEAVKNMDAAAKELADTRKKLGANSIEAAIAEGKLKAAQADVNAKTLAARDATAAVTAALAKEKDARDKAKSSIDSYNKAIKGSLDGLLGALSATRGLASAQQALRDAQQNVVDIQKRQGEIPGELAKADQDLARAQAESATVKSLAEVTARQNVAAAQAKVKEVTADSAATDLDKQQAVLELSAAMDALNRTLADNLGPTADVASATARIKELQAEQTTVARQLTDANSAVEDATLGVVEAERKIIEQADALGNATGKARSFFEAIAEAAGLSRSEIEKLLAAIDAAATKVGQPIKGNPLVAQPGNASDPFLNTVTGRQAYTGPGGEAGSASKQAIADYAKAHGINPALIQHSNVGGVGAYYIPGVAVDPGNLGAIANLSQMPTATPNVGSPSTRSNDGVTFHAAGAPSIEANFYPQTAVFDESTAGAYLQNLELLYS